MREEANFRLATITRPSHHPKPRILFLSPRALIRDCIGALLSRLAPDFEVACFQSVDDRIEEDVCLVIAWADEAEAAASNYVSEQAARCSHVLPKVPFLAFVSREHRATLIDRIGHDIALLCVETATAEIAEAGIRLAVAGECFVSARLIPADGGDLPGQRDPQLILHTSKPCMSYVKSDHPAPAAPRAIMTRRELELLERVDRGQQNKVIAYELGISESTVKVHLRNLMRKLNATNRTQVAFIARQLNVKH
jgi:DNA-binding NarL/FixJ family response regulator